MECFHKKEEMSFKITILINIINTLCPHCSVSKPSSRPYEWKHCHCDFVIRFSYLFMFHYGNEYKTSDLFIIIVRYTLLSIWITFIYYQVTIRPSRNVDWTLVSPPYRDFTIVFRDRWVPTTIRPAIN